LPAQGWLRASPNSRGTPGKTAKLGRGEIHEVSQRLLSSAQGETR
jgi:hypothetical protein